MFPVQARKGVTCLATRMACTRKIHSAEFLGIPDFQRFQEDIASRIGNIPFELQRIKKDFGIHGSQGLKNNDWNNLILFSQKKDMPSVYQMVKSHIEDPRVDTKLKSKFLSKCVQVCYLSQDLDYSRKFTQEPFFEVFVTGPFAVLCHLTFLYNEGHYEEVVETYKQIKKFSNIPNNSQINQSWVPFYSLF